jgi:hypothetical protein
MADSTETTTASNGERVPGRVPRRDARIQVTWNAACEKVVEIDQKLPPQLDKVYQRVRADPSNVGKRFQATLRDLSANGAFIEAEPLPLLSRVAMVIEIPRFKNVEAVGWVLWRRSAPCTIDLPNGAPVTLGAGFGIMFEWISLEARLEIARRVALLA